MKIVIVSSSLNPGSRSRRLALEVKARLEAGEDVEVDFIDLQELELPLCDGGVTYGDARVVELGRRMFAADAFVLASPIYNYDLNAAMKNVVEFSGRAMENKLVGFLCSAGGAMSFMSVMGFANSLMLDFRSIILPRFVYAIDDDWEGDLLKAPVAARLIQFTDSLVEIGRKLSGR